MPRARQSRGHRTKKWPELKWYGKGLFWVVVGLAVLALPAAIISLANTGTQSQCKQGWLLAHGRLLDQAESTYARAGGNCEKAGGTSVARAQKAAGRALESAGALVANRPRAAILRYVQGLDANPFEERASQGLEKALAGLPPPKTAREARRRCNLSAKMTAAGLLAEAGDALSQGFVHRPAPRPCGRVLRKLSLRREYATALLGTARVKGEAGNDSAERLAYASALRADPALNSARTGLEGSLDNESNLESVTSWLEDVADWLKDSLGWIVPLLVGLIIIAGAVWTILSLAAAKSARIYQVFCKLGSWPLLGLLRRAAMPNLKFAEFDGEGAGSAMKGSDFSALLRDRLPQPAVRAPAFPFDRAGHGSTEDQDAAKVAEALDLVPQTKLIGAALGLWQMLTRQRIIELSGNLAPIGDLGAGVTITIDGNGVPGTASITIWEATFDPSPATANAGGAERWLRLVAPAAVWARWQLHAVADPSLPVDTESWLADALFQAGGVWQLKDEWVKAESLYSQALERDSMLLPAAHNLGKLEMRSGLYAQAITRFERLLRLLDEDKPLADGKRPLELWPTLNLSALYSLTLARAYRELKNEGGDGSSSARDTAVDMVTGIAKAILNREAKERENVEPTSQEREEADELRNAELPSVAVLAGLKVRDSNAEASSALQQIEALAPGGLTNAPPLLRTTIRDEAAQLSAWKLIELYVLRQPNLSRRTHYNLACYYTTLAGLAVPSKRSPFFDRALTELEVALEGDELAGWAERDPALGPLQRARGADFHQIVKKRRLKTAGR